MGCALISGLSDQTLAPPVHVCRTLKPEMSRWVGSSAAISLCVLCLCVFVRKRTGECDAMQCKRILNIHWIFECQHLLAKFLSNYDCFSSSFCCVLLRSGSLRRRMLMRRLSGRELRKRTKKSNKGYIMIVGLNSNELVPFHRGNNQSNDMIRPFTSDCFVRAEFIYNNQVNKSIRVV